MEGIPWDIIWQHKLLINSGEQLYYMFFYRYRLYTYTTLPWPIPSSNPKIVCVADILGYVSLYKVIFCRLSPFWNPRCILPLGTITVLGYCPTLWSVISKICPFVKSRRYPNNIQNKSDQPLVEMRIYVKIHWRWKIIYFHGRSTSWIFRRISLRIWTSQIYPRHIPAQIYPTDIPGKIPLYSTSHGLTTLVSAPVPHQWDPLNPTSTLG